MFKKASKKPPSHFPFPSSASLNERTTTWASFHSKSPNEYLEKREKCLTKWERLQENAKNKSRFHCARPDNHFIVLLPFDGEHRAKRTMYVSYKQTRE